MVNDFGKEKWALKKIFDAILNPPEFLDCHRYTGVFISKLSDAIDFSIDKKIEIRTFGLPSSGMIAHSEIFIDNKRIRNKYLDQSFELDNYKHLFSINGNSIAQFITVSKKLDSNLQNGLNKVIDEFDDLVISHQTQGSIGYFKNEKKDFLSEAERIGLITKVSDEQNMTRYQITEQGIETYLDFLIFYSLSGNISKYELDKRFTVMEGKGLPENTIAPKPLSQYYWRDNKNDRVNSILLSGRDADNLSLLDWTQLKDEIMDDLNKNHNLNNPNLA